MEYNDTLRSARMQVLVDAIDASPAVMRYYSGTKPASVSTAITDQVLLVELDFQIPCSTVVQDGVAYMKTLAEKLALESGEVAFARIVSQDETVIADLDVGEISSDLTVGNPVIYKGAMIRVLNWTLSDELH